MSEDHTHDWEYSDFCYESDIYVCKTCGEGQWVMEGHLPK